MEIYTGTGVATDIYINTPDGFLKPSESLIMPYGFKDVSDMLDHHGFTWAHRGSSSMYSEMSLKAYTEAVRRNYGVLEVSLNRSSDGVWFGLHDQTLDRVINGSDNLDPSTMTWDQIKQYSIVRSGSTPSDPQPFMKWEDYVDAYGNSHVVVVDPKHRHSSHRNEFFDMLGDLDPTKIIIKFYYDTPSLASMAEDRGMASWGYLYTHSLSDPQLTTRVAPWTLLGFEHSATQQDWDTVLSFGKPVVGHIAQTQAQYNDAMSKGAVGVQCGGIHQIAAVR